MKTKVKYLVIGGGLSGLSFLHFIKDDDYLLIEKDSRFLYLSLYLYF